jgi:hypothetical protein
MAADLNCGEWFRSPFLLAEAKGVAGLGKAGGDGQAGSDKAGQQVPPEVYMALTYAGTLFLFTLSVPLILYGLNKLLNKIEDCFGCGSSSKEKRAAERMKQQHHYQQHESPSLIPSSDFSANFNQQKSVAEQQNSAPIFDQTRFHPGNATKQFQQNNNQQLNPQLLKQHPKYAQFVSMSSKLGYHITSQDDMGQDKARSQQHPPLVDLNIQQNMPRDSREVTLTPTAAA